MGLNTQHLGTSPADLEKAAALLQGGALVAFPTETVYGLGGDAHNDHAVASIYATKARPQFNPLIVHVDSAETARRYAEFDDSANRLADAFWPGPMTLVLPMRADNGLSALCTAGLDTVAIRVPEHPVARALLARFDGPLAAPSANPSGKISPTTAEHVLAGLGGQIAAVVDGGACVVGLESTIIAPGEPPTLLRPGGLTGAAVTAILGCSLAEPETDKVVAPGALRSHYAPDARVRLNATEARDDEFLIGFGPVAGDITLSASGDTTEAAAQLFGALHIANQSGRPIAIAPIPDTGLGVAINDRLQRAAAPRPSGASSRP